MDQGRAEAPSHRGAVCSAGQAPQLWDTWSLLLMCLDASVVSRWSPESALGR